jgi:hypothetical protein
MHPGGGHFVILSRLIGCGAAAAMALFGEEIDDTKAVQLGLAWESVDDADVEECASELAGRVAADPEMARVAVGNFRREVVNGAVSWEVASQFERPAQMWSMRRQARRDCDRSHRLGDVQVREVEVHVGDVHDLGAHGLGELLAQGPVEGASPTRGAIRAGPSLRVLRSASTRASTAAGVMPDSRCARLGRSASPATSSARQRASHL